MEVIVLEKKIFDDLQNRLSDLTRRVETLRKLTEPKIIEDWVDWKYVTRILHVSKRTLGVYRALGVLPYTLIGNQAFYKPEDVEHLILNGRILFNK